MVVLCLISHWPTSFPIFNDQQFNSNQGKWTVWSCLQSATRTSMATTLEKGSDPVAWIISYLSEKECWKAPMIHTFQPAICNNEPCSPTGQRTIPYHSGRMEQVKGLLSWCDHRKAWSFSTARKASFTSQTRAPSLCQALSQTPEHRIRMAQSLPWEVQNISGKGQSINLHLWWVL